MVNKIGDRELLEMARRAALFAYAPYSGFTVGAAILTKDGTAFTGCNIENSSFGLTICAERVALFKGVAEGHINYERLALWARSPVWPCGACLQCLAEFSPGIRIIRLSENGEVEETLLNELLTSAFSLDNR